MKKISSIIAGLAIVFSASAFTGPGDKAVEELTSPSRPTVGIVVSNSINASLLKDFSTADAITWKEKEGLYFAYFKVNNNDFFAAYSPEGELLGLSRRLDISQLPLKVMQALSEKMAGYNLENSVTELIFEGQTNYYLNAEGKTKILQLKCSPSGDIAVENRIKKKQLVGSVY
ncbi:MAG: hypothetical protein JWQ27_1449 [Ferruginibacter sp.]|nr:hypothetical protein [Ferruginibacter sp.]